MCFVLFGLFLVDLGLGVLFCVMGLGFLVVGGLVVLFVGWIVYGCCVLVGFVRCLGWVFVLGCGVWGGVFWVVFFWVVGFLYTFIC